MVAGAGEQSLEADEKGGVGARVAVDDLVVVAHSEHVQLGRRQEPQQQHVRRRQVLKLVHQQVAAAGLGPAPERPVGQQQLQGPVDLLVEVDRPCLLEGRPVRIEGGRQAGNVVAPLLHLFGIAQPEADLAQRLHVRADGIGVGPLAPDGHESLDEAPHLALVEQARGAMAGLGQQPVPQRVQRAHPGGNVDGALLHLLLRLLVVGHGQHAVALVAPIHQQMAHPLGQHPGLPRSGRGDDAGGTGAVADRGQLIRRQVGAGHDRRRHQRHRSQLHRLPVDQPQPIQGVGRQRGPGTAVDPRHGPIGEAHVARLAPLDGRDSVEAARLAGPPPHWGLGVRPGVVGVGPHQEMVPVGPGIEIRPELPRRISAERTGARGTRPDRPPTPPRRGPGRPTPDAAGRRHRPVPPAPRRRR